MPKEEQRYYIYRLATTIYEFPAGLVYAPWMTKFPSTIEPSKRPTIYENEAGLTRLSSDIARAAIAHWRQLRRDGDA